MFLSDGVIIKNISVKEFLYYIRCEANRFLEKRSNQGRSGDGDIEEDSERAKHTTARGDESGLEGHRRRGGVSGGQWSGTVLFTHQSSDGNRPQEANQDMETIRLSFERRIHFSKVSDQLQQRRRQQ